MLLTLGSLSLRNTMRLVTSLLTLSFLLLLFLPCQAQLPGQIMIDPQNPSWMVYNRDSNSDGKLDPAFICGPGDPEDFLYRGTRNGDGTRTGDQQAIINNMKARGSNGIYFQVIRSHGGDGESDHNPFINSDPSQGFDLDILVQWDGWLNQLDQAGIVIYFFFYDDSARIWSGDSVGTEEQAFISTLVKRYQHLKHLVWVVAEEYAERLSATRVSNIARTILEADDNNHVVANHQNSSTVFDHPNDPYLSQFAAQYNVSTADALHAGMVSAWNSASGRYSVMMAEAAGHGIDSRTNCRQKNWASAMGGAYVMILGMDGTSAYNEKMMDCRNQKTFFEQTDFNTMSPRDDLGNSGTWVLANPGTSYIAYRRAKGNITINQMRSGNYTLTWLDQASGNTGTQTLTLSHGSNTLFRPSGIGDEAAVWLKRTNGVVSPPPTRPNSHVNLLLLHDEAVEKTDNTYHFPSQEEYIP